MYIASEIERSLTEAFAPELIQVSDDSGDHARGNQSHFSVLMVADRFANLSRVQRHQQVYRVLADLLEQKIHALALRLYTPQEWHQRNGSPAAPPPCVGGGD